jgi:hypothetical protein
MGAEIFEKKLIKVLKGPLNNPSENINSETHNFLIKVDGIPIMSGDGTIKNSTLTETRFSISESQITLEYSTDSELRSTITK